MYVIWNDEKCRDISGKQISAQFLDKIFNDKISQVERANSKYPLPEVIRQGMGWHLLEIVEGIYILDGGLDP